MMNNKTKRAVATVIVVLLVLAMIVTGVVYMFPLAEQNPSDEVSAYSSDFKAGDVNDTDITGTKPAITSESAVKTEQPYYYDSARSARYTAYFAEHPEIAENDVIWMVNVDLDEAPYENTQPIQDVDVLPLLVNKHFYLPNDYVPKDLVTSNDGHVVTSATNEAFNRMQAAAKAEGYSFRMQSAYRSIALQIELYNGYVARDGDAKITDTYSARPGYSEHHTGRTIDLAGPNGDMERFGEEKEAAWVRENSWKYGFIVRYTEENRAITDYKPEPWHVTFIGEEAARIMHEENFSALEEYVAKYVLASPR